MNCCYFLSQTKTESSPKPVWRNICGETTWMRADSYDFIYTHIKNLRRELLKKGCKDYIKTIYGLGYKFDLT